MSGKTIQIYLPSGDPRGMRIAEITTRIVRCFEVPRSELNSFLKRAESQQVGVYFLLGESDTGVPSVYIGQTGLLSERLKQHHQRKDFWTRALAVVSLTNNWTQTHATYLEWLCIELARKADRYALENANEGSKPFTPEALEADCHEVFETVRFLTTTLGYPLFEVLRATRIETVADMDAAANQIAGQQTQESIVYQCSGKGCADAKGIYTSEGFVVFKGSKARKSAVPSLTTKAGFSKTLATLLQTNRLTETNDVFVFSEDVLFPSPSSASGLVMGRSSNGWIDWIASDGRTLDSIERKSV
jgi:predicted GIY-YIG superfamily endonuclease